MSAPAASAARNREGAEVGVGAHDFRRERAAGEHLLGTGCAQCLDLRHQVVAQHGGNFQVNAFGLRRRHQRGAAGGRVDAAGVGNDLDAARLQFLHQGLKGGDEIWRITQCRVLGLGAAEQRHGDFGQVVEHQNINGAMLNQLGGCELGVAPEA